jgi:hypothetical protein
MDLNEDIQGVAGADEPHLREVGFGGIDQGSIAR